MPHEKKRALKGAERAAVQKELLYKKAIVWHREATEEMEYGDPEPSHLYATDVLRKARQEGKDKELGVHKVQDPIACINDLKYNVEYAGIIREIGLNKFYCMYWSPLQIDIYKDVIKLNNIISIDATGSIAQKLDCKNRRSGAIFLYQAVASGSSGIVPLFQMLSEKHDANIMQYWMSEWLRSGGTIPREVVTDFSFALLNAVTRAFNNCSLSYYIKICLKTLNCEQNTKDILPICFIRLDIAHVIKMITRWQCFHGKAPRIKDFYMRCIGFLTTVETKSQFENILYAILIVALSECNDKDTECANKQEFLLQIIRDFAIDETENCNNKDTDFNDYYLLDEVDTGLKDGNLPNFGYLRINAENSAIKARSGQHPNAYYCPEFITPFLRFSVYYILWTNVITQINKSKHYVATSARSEAYFNDIKNIMLSDEGKPLRVDKFVIKHIRAIKSICKIERAALNNRNTIHNSKLMETDQLKHTPSNTNEVSTDDLDSFTYSAEENWRGLNPLKKETTVQSTKKQRGKYLTACPNVTLIHNRPLRKRKNACIQNGSLLPPTKIGTTKIQVVSTCPFDATVELLAIAYADSVVYKKTVDTKYKDLIFFQMIINYATKGVSNAFYFERTSFLITLFNKEESIINCAYNISNLIAKLLVEAPSLKERSICTKCNHEEINNIPVAEINSKPILQHGLYIGLQMSVDTFFLNKEISCKNCGIKTFKEINPDAHLLIDTEHAFHSMLLNKMGLPDVCKNVSLSQIPTHIDVKNEKYQLLGIISYNGHEQEVGHYIAYCYRVGQKGIWEEYDDLKNKRTTLQPTVASYTFVKPSIIAYIKLQHS